MSVGARAGIMLAACLAMAGTPALAVAAGSPDAGAAAATAAPSTVAPAADEAIVAAIRTAVVNHDLDYFEKQLVDWDGARKRTQRLTLFQIRECFGRPIKSVGIEPLKPDPTSPLVPDGYRTNLPVTHLLRIAFDEQHGPDETPACVFMLSKTPSANLGANPSSAYRMVLVLPNGAPPK